MKLIIKPYQTIIIMKNKDLKTILVVIRYIATFVAGILSGNLDTLL